jgi:ATP-dependent DNA ligase
MGGTLTTAPLRERKRLLRESVDFTDPIRYRAHRNGDGEQFLREACDKKRRQPAEGSGN